jgi:hypothetical protein
LHRPIAIELLALIQVLLGAVGAKGVKESHSNPL